MGPRIRLVTSSVLRTAPQGGVQDASGTTSPLQDEPTGTSGFGGPGTVDICPGSQPSRQQGVCCPVCLGSVDPTVTEYELMSDHRVYRERVPAYWCGSCGIEIPASGVGQEFIDSVVRQISAKRPWMAEVDHERHG